MRFTWSKSESHEVAVLQGAHQITKTACDGESSSQGGVKKPFMAKTTVNASLCIESLLKDHVQKSVLHCHLTLCRPWL